MSHPGSFQQLRIKMINLETPNTWERWSAAQKSRRFLDNITLSADVRAFQKASLAGKYYQAFAVNSKNYREKSVGRLAWIADCLRLLERCLAQSKKEDPKTVCQAFEIIFSLLSKIDEDNDDILFFADEGGSWQVGVD
jgi:hypothetical protein